MTVRASASAASDVRITRISTAACAADRFQFARSMACLAPRAFRADRPSFKPTPVCRAGPTLASDEAEYAELRAVRGARAHARPLRDVRARARQSEPLGAERIRAPRVLRSRLRRSSSRKPVLRAICARETC